MVPVQLADGSLTWLLESALEPVGPAPETLSARLRTGRFVDVDWLRSALTRIRVTGQLRDVVYSMEATATDFYAHQFKPVLKILNSPTDALLIADEVGLGKTIEAGLIWTELRARLESNRLLVLCPKTLCEKWRAELDRRFGVDARIVNASDLLSLLDSTASSTRGFAAIAGMQSLRPPKGWDKDDEAGDAFRVSARVGLARLLSDAGADRKLIDLLIVDEAHHMRNPETALYQLAEMLNEVSSHRVFLSATPIHLRNRDLNSILRLVDAETFEFDSTLNEIILANAPLVAARDLVLRQNSSADQVRLLITEAMQHEFLSESRALALLLDELRLLQLDPASRADIAWRLEQANQLSNYLTRTRRRDVEDFRVVREPIARHLEMHAEERIFYDAISAEVSSYARERTASERFLLSSPQRLLTSSFAAASQYWIGPDGQHASGSDEVDEDINEKAEDFRPLVSRLGRCARRLDMSARLKEVDSKFRLLQQQLGSVWTVDATAKIIIFSSFKPTLNYLNQRFREIGIKCDLLHGSIDEPRADVLSRFQHDPSVRILLSSEIGSEGVDLQFCWIVVNYDLPWNPMRVEQRIGRIDRLGQRKPKVTVINLLHAGTIDDTIYRRLYERLELSKRALGEFEAVLGEPIREMTLKLLDPTLTEEQQAAAVDQAAQALETRSKTERELEDEAGSLLRHGDYVLRKIRESRQLSLRGEDILLYVRDRLRRSFAGCAIEASTVGTDTHTILLTPDAKDAFATFLAKRRMRGSTRLIEGNDRLRYRFTSSVVRATEHGVENISQMHPLVRFAAELDLDDVQSRTAQPVAATIATGKVAGEHLRAGSYVVVMRQWIGTDSQGRPSGGVRLAYAGAEIFEGSSIGPDQCEALVAAVAQFGRVMPNAANDPRLLSASDALNGVVLPNLDSTFSKFVNQMKAEVEDRATIRLRALDRHMMARTKVLEHKRFGLVDREGNLRSTGQHRDADRIANLVKATDVQLQKLRTACDLRMREIGAERIVQPEEQELACLFVEVKD